MTGKVPRLSVVIPVYDMARFLGEAIGSALSQTVPDLEVIVVDDGSNDDVAAVLARQHDARVRTVRQPHSGLSAARNRGVEEARAPVVGFLDADDRLRPRGAATLCAALARTPAAVLAYGDAVPMDEGGRVFGSERPPLFARRPSGDVLEPLLRRNFIASAGGAAVRASALRATGPFRVDLPRAQDWEMWCRLAVLGTFVYVGGPPLLERRSHDRSISRTLGTGVEAALRAVDAAFSAPEVADRFTPAALARLRRERAASVHAVAGTECLKARRYDEARRHFLRALRLDPTSLREALLCCSSVLRWVPRALERRLQ
jgi:glycosyltransferase involved in cell wall biosynthesis